MLKKLLVFFIFIFCLYGSEKDFSFHKMQGDPTAPTLLVIGGVHGDEPGGYFAPVLMLKHYEIKKGSVYVVPNLNFDSILEFRRGKYGDMNRKFAEISPNDKDYHHVQRIKEIITLPEVAFVTNLHDGRGFYRHKWENAIFNPSAWGQSYIIDQKTIDDVPFGNLDEITSKMESILNKDLHEDYHNFNIKNTETKEVDEEMQRSLTYFAVTNQKPAIAVETSKNITELDLKVIYQLRSFEALMDVMGIEYTSNIDLSSREDIQRSIDEYGVLKINDNFTMELGDIKFATRFVPMQKGDNKIEFSHPLGALIKRENYYDIHIGHMRIGTLYPQYFDFNDTIKSAKIEVDGLVKDVKFGDIIEVTKDFKVLPLDGIRVNVIGFVTKGKISQDSIVIKKSDIIERFAMDKQNSIYRIEFYDQNSFYGMIGVKFR